MNNLLVGLGLGILIKVIMDPIGNFIADHIKLYTKTKKISFKKAIDEKITDQKTNKLIRDIILNAEKALGSKTGRAKFEYAKSLILKAVPDLFDPLTEKVLQAIYDSMVEEGGL